MLPVQQWYTALAWLPPAATSRPPLVHRSRGGSVLRVLGYGLIRAGRAIGRRAPRRDARLAHRGFAG